MLAAFELMKHKHGCNSVSQTAMLALQLARNTSYGTISPGQICSFFSNTDMVECLPYISHSSKLHALNPGVCS
jgi:hypothetical protein